MIDLHLHSVFSDGSSSIEDILEEAYSLGLTQISITDHNIIDGSVLASKKCEIDYIIGTELSANYNGIEIHLLSYFPNGSDYKNINFIIKEGEIYKKVAILEMIENLNAMGFDIDITELSEFTKGAFNRVHICKALMKHGYIESIAEGFDKYIGNHCPAFVERKKVSLEEAIDAVHMDGGLAVIAHPFEYKKLESIQGFLEKIVDKIDGIECFHPSANEENTNFLVEFATKHNKLITGGSDFHGDNKTNIFMGMMNVDDKYSIKK